MSIQKIFGCFGDVKEFKQLRHHICTPYFKSKQFDYAPFYFGVVVEEGGSFKDFVFENERFILIQAGNLSVDEPLK